MAKGKYEFYSFKCWRPGKNFGKKRWDFRYRFNNGNILCFSNQGYNNLADVMNGITELQNSKKVEVVEVKK